jgi:hypothetical protein
MNLEEKIRETLKNEGIKFKDLKSFVLQCPYCKNEKIGILKHNGHWKCFKCESDGVKSGNVADLFVLFTDKPKSYFVGLIYGQGLSNADLDFIFNRETLEEEVVEVSRKQIFQKVDLNGFLRIDNPKCEKARHYLFSRNVSIEKAVKYFLMVDLNEERIVIPAIRDGICIGYQARLYSKQDPNSKFKKAKIKTSSGFKKNLALLFEQNLKNSEHTIVCEGPFDAIAADVCGGVVATMGKEVSKEQIQILNQSDCAKVYVALDPDAAKEKERLCNSIINKEIYLLNIPEKYKDLGEMPESEIVESFLRAPKWDKYMPIFYFGK